MPPPISSHTEQIAAPASVLLIADYQQKNIGEQEHAGRSPYRSNQTTKRAAKKTSQGSCQIYSILYYISILHFNLYLNLYFISSNKKIKK